MDVNTLRPRIDTVAKYLRHTNAPKSLNHRNEVSSFTPAGCSHAAVFLVFGHLHQSKHLNSWLDTISNPEMFTESWYLSETVEYLISELAWHTGKAICSPVNNHCAAVDPERLEFTLRLSPLVGETSLSFLCDSKRYHHVPEQPFTFSGGMPSWDTIRQDDQNLALKLLHLQGV